MEQFERVPEKHRLRGGVSKRNVPRGHIGPAERVLTPACTKMTGKALTKGRSDVSLMNLTHVRLSFFVKSLTIFHKIYG